MSQKEPEIKVTINEGNDTASILMPGASAAFVSKDFLDIARREAEDGKITVEQSLINSFLTFLREM